MEGLLAFSSHEELDRLNQEARHSNRPTELFALCQPADEVRQSTNPCNESVPGQFLSDGRVVVVDGTGLASDCVSSFILGESVLTVLSGNLQTQM